MTQTEAGANFKGRSKTIINLACLVLFVSCASNTEKEKHYKVFLKSMLSSYKSIKELPEINVPIVNQCVQRKEFDHLLNSVIKSFEECSLKEADTEEAHASLKFLYGLFANSSHENFKYLVESTAVLDFFKESRIELEIKKKSQEDVIQGNIEKAKEQIIEQQLSLLNTLKTKIGDVKQCNFSSAVKFFEDALICTRTEYKTAYENLYLNSYRSVCVKLKTDKECLRSSETSYSIYSKFLSHSTPYHHQR